MMRSAVRFALLTSLIGGAACDPCAGTANCNSSNSGRLVIDGQIVRPQDGRGVDGIRIDVLRRGGAALGADSMSVVTSNGGFWHVSTTASGASEAVLDVRVTTPVLAHPYMVSGLHVPVVTRDGDAYLADRWVSDPYFAYYFQFFQRGEPNVVFPDAAVSFHQTGGSLLIGASRDSVVHSATDTYGMAQMFVYNAFASDTGAIIGDVSIQLPKALGVSVVRGVRLSPTYIYRASPQVPRVGVGPSVQYSAAVFDRATGKPMSGIRVDVVHFDGIGIDPGIFSMTTDAGGYAHFATVALAAGKLIADITIHPTIGNPETFRDTILTFDSDVPQLLANWTAGAVMPYYGIVRSFGLNLANVPVRVRRTGGIQVTPADTVVNTLDNGLLFINPRPLAAGDVTLELTFTPPPPYPRFVVSNVVLSTVQRDTQGIDVWNWDLDRGISGPPGSQVTILP